jgi:hypothetical protein
LILVDHPFQRAAVAQAVAERLGRDARERERWVDRQRRLVLREGNKTIASMNAARSNPLFWRGVNYDRRSAADST